MSDKGHVIAPTDTWEYERPANATLVMDAPVYVAEDPSQFVYVKQYTYRGYTVDFALSHVVELEEGNSDVARYDCCHSEVHRHQFHKSGEELRRKVIAPIRDQRTSWSTVNAVYDECYDDMIEGWEHHYRRWDE